MPGRQSTGPIAQDTKTKHARRKKQRSLNALAIAEKTNPEHARIQKHRLGESEPDGNIKRKRAVAQRDDSNDPNSDDGPDRDMNPKTRKTKPFGGRIAEIDYGSDSEGNEWILGGIESGDDESLDSDEALGGSDEEKFEGFVFRGSSSGTASRQTRVAGEDEISNGEFDLSEGDEEIDDDFGDEGMDMAAVLDAGSESEDEEGILVDSQLSESNVEVAHQSSEDRDSEILVSDEENDHQDSGKLAELHSLVTAMNEKDESQAIHQRIPNVNESKAPSEYGINSRQKLTVEDLLTAVTDPQLKKSLRILAQHDKKSSSRHSGIAKKLDVPLPKRQQDRLDRKAAYEKSKETLNRWIDTVKHNRRAEHLSFPLQEQDRDHGLGTNKLDRKTKPLTELEKTIQNILQESGLAPADGKTEEDQIQAFEELETNKMPLAEVQKRRAVLRRSRDLLFREEIKAKRINKIKSKSYRRVHRRERERLLQKDKDALAAIGEEDSESEKEKNDRRRAEERMGAKHRESRWAKGVKESGRMAWDEDARGGVEEMARREEDLKRRILGKDVDEDDEESSEHDGYEDDDKDGNGRGGEPLKERLEGLDEDQDVSKLGVRNSTSALLSMQFMQNADAAQKASNDEAVRQMQRELAGEETPSEEEPEERAGRRLYGPKRDVPQSSKSKVEEPRSEFEEKLDPDDEVAPPAQSNEEELQIIVDHVGPKKHSTQKKSKEVKVSSIPPSQGTEDNPWLSSGKPKPSTRERKAQDKGAAAIISNDLPNTVLNAVTRGKQVKSGMKAARLLGTDQVVPKTLANVHTSGPGESSEEEEEEDGATGSKCCPSMLRNQELVRQAFAGDDVVANFEKEKEETMKSEDEKTVDETLAGWGHWTGAGIGKKVQRRNKNQILAKQAGIPKAQRQDAKLDKVIINEKRVKKNSKYLASQLPHPFETRQQYERSLRLPVGPEWTTKETFQAATKPRVLMKQGIIKPMVKPMM
ncbi:MAG: hypothetical protein LQ337_002378 [Flavoplaca oasis]|nr:MAG: hypothetical protein LQ337_002378 [Flavoplaca oasis]